MTPHLFSANAATQGAPLVEKLVHDIDEQLEHTSTQASAPA
ncbi:hypothetical protein [Cupriavidus lacunae]|nr:hypothetical protein [Cupriavidus lacunae]